MTERLDTPLETPEGHLAGHPVSVWTWTKHGCRCGGCWLAQNEARPKKEAKADPNGHVWLDWSGETGVWVCDHCTEQGFAGFDLTDAKNTALRHWRTEHPELKGQTAVSVIQPCMVTTTIWGAATDEHCDEDAYIGGLCKTHYGMNRLREQRGYCEWDGCWNNQSPKAVLCQQHVKEWASEKGVRVGLVSSGTVPYEEAS